MAGIYHDKNEPRPDNCQMRLLFNRDPLSCIITLADILQDFERPKIDFGVHKRGSVFKYDHACQETRLLNKNNELEIIYKFKSDNDRVLNIPFKQEDEIKYFHEDDGYLDFSSIGIQKVKINTESIKK
ncbi:MAG: hypothetical protein WCM76_12085 [Bacteroidota bacterium]